MTTDYERLRAAIKAERDEPGPVTKAEIDAVLAENPPADPPAPDRFDDTRFDPTRFG